MLEHNRIDVLEGIDTNKTDKWFEQIIRHY